MMTLLYIILFFASVGFVTFVTAPDRHQQVLRLRGFFDRISYFQRGDVRRYFTLGKITKWLVTLFLLGFLWVYLTLFYDMRAMLEQRELELDVGTLQIPVLAIFKSEFTAEVGFSRRKRRQRVPVLVTGNVFTGFTPVIEETSMAKLARLTGKPFEFNFLSDVKVLRPAIDAYMRSLIRNKVISFFEIETFDNRGPYMLVIMAEARRSGDLDKEAKKIADGLYNNLTATRELKVNQVIVKVIKAEDYEKDKTLTVLARGQAGTY